MTALSSSMREQEEQGAAALALLDRTWHGMAWQAWHGTIRFTANARRSTESDTRLIHLLEALRVQVQADLDVCQALDLE